MSNEIVEDHDICHEMCIGEILNEKNSEYPLFYAKLYGDRVATAKLSKRLSCSIKHLPIRIFFDYEYDTLKALEAGVRKNPTLILEGKIFLEGLIQAEDITKVFQKFLKI